MRTLSPTEVKRLVKSHQVVSVQNPEEPGAPTSFHWVLVTTIASQATPKRVINKPPVLRPEIPWVRNVGKSHVVWGPSWGDWRAGVM